MKYIILFLIYIFVFFIGANPDFAITPQGRISFFLCCWYAAYIFTSTGGEFAMKWINENQGKSFNIFKFIGGNVWQLIQRMRQSTA